LPLAYRLSVTGWARFCLQKPHRLRWGDSLHFFEALAEFMATILLSGFHAWRKPFRAEWAALAANLAEQHLSLERSTFGVWVAIAGYWAKVLRRLAGQGPARQQTTELFQTSNGEVLAMLGSSSLVRILSETNRYRNSWTGHGGIVSDREARERHDMLAAHMEEVRGVFGTVWEQYTLVRPGPMEFAAGIYQCTVQRVMGNRTPFETMVVELEHPLEREQLYLVVTDERRALPLLPFIKVLPSPETAQNACYFYNRQQRSGELRFVSYHFEPQGELVREFPDTLEALQSLSTLTV
ncbi:MAG: hypothetical protein JW900_04945, partial [Anaerolineae bacterium]|nr:hypothetical protein [Anaerolineae bacterium]